MAITKYRIWTQPGEPVHSGDETNRCASQAAPAAQMEKIMRNTNTLPEN
jgi:hypothetical protein